MGASKMVSAATVGGLLLRPRLARGMIRGGVRYVGNNPLCRESSESAVIPIPGDEMDPHMAQVYQDIDEMLRDPSEAERKWRLEQQAIRIIRQEEELARAKARLDQQGNRLSSRESRLAVSTRIGKYNTSQMVIPESIQQHIQSSLLPKNSNLNPSELRTIAAQVFANLKYSNHQPCESAHQTHVHLAAIFPQNYASVRQSLTNLIPKLKQGWRPERILDIGFGPATGLLAWNDLLCELEINDWRPERQTVVITSHSSMAYEAKGMLASQAREIKHILSQEAIVKMGESVEIIRRIPNRLNEYDLIISTHQLLPQRSEFPQGVDQVVEKIVPLLSLQKNSVLVLVERGDPIGFETIARARESILRPGPIRPLPNTKESRPFQTVGDLKLERENLDGQVEVVDADISEEELDALINKEQVEDLKRPMFKIIAPCPHHGHCPLQMGNLFTGKRRAFCGFSRRIQRTNTMLHLKRGNILSTQWKTELDDMGNEQHYIVGDSKGGKGRRGGKGFEDAHFSFVIFECNKENEGQGEKMTEDELVNNKNEDELINDSTIWPRVINNPIKRHRHVTIDVCNSNSNFERWIIPKSLGKQIYHDGRKIIAGDKWPLGGKTKTLVGSWYDKNTNIDVYNQLKESKRQEKVVDANEIIIDNDNDKWISRFKASKIAYKESKLITAFDAAENAALASKQRKQENKQKRQLNKLRCEILNGEYELPKDMSSDEKDFIVATHVNNNLRGNDKD